MFPFLGLKKIKFNTYVYIRIILAKKLFNFVSCSVVRESFEITSVNTSSTLN